MVERLRGFRDFYPEEQEIRRVIFNTMKERCRSFGFKEIDGPSIESMQLYSHKVGQQITTQMFSFKDKGGRDVTLIPEFTPSLSRMVSTRKDLVKPLKWYSLTKFWRYEEPQSGRFREFYQLNADILGSESYLADAEVTTLAADILISLGISSKVKLRVNSRILMDSIIERFLENKKEESYFILDGWNKYTDEERMKVAEEKKLDTDTLKLIASGNILKEYSSPELDKLKMTIELIKNYGDIDVELDLRVVRGLAYYTGFVFEAWDKEEKMRAILGGGRYDNIISQLGGDRTPAVGFAIGDAVIENIMKHEGLWVRKQDRSVFIATIDKKGIDYSILVAKKLRDLGVNSDKNVVERGISKQLEYAAKMGYERVIILGENEFVRKSVVVKNLTSGKQEEIKIDHLEDIVN